MVSDGGVASLPRREDRRGPLAASASAAASPRRRSLADGKVYFQSEDGVGTVVKAGTKFELLAENELGERTLASYAAADGALFIRTEKHLYRIQAK